MMPSNRVKISNPKMVVQILNKKKIELAKSSNKRKKFKPLIIEQKN